MGLKIVVLKTMLVAGLIFQGFFSLAQNWEIDDIKIYNQFEELEHIFHFQNDTTYVINFWATWCGPCVKEMPYIDSLNDHYKGQKVKVILVSLDFKKQIESRLIPYLNKK